MMFKPAMAGVQVVKYGSSSHSLPLFTTSVENFYRLNGKRFHLSGKDAAFTGIYQQNKMWEIVGKKFAQEGECQQPKDIGPGLKSTEEQSKRRGKKLIASVLNTSQ